MDDPAAAKDFAGKETFDYDASGESYPVLAGGYLGKDYKRKKENRINVILQ